MLNSIKTPIIRQKFLTYFQKKQHTIARAVPIINKEDPQLLFVNAGMNPFKNIFLNHQKPEHKRIANTQPCLRVSGKHNDLSAVGTDTYHHTLFEMLGNWSFGDYFKQEAIQWAWELLTQIYKLPIEQLYVTVFAGDKILSKDEDSYQIWQKYITKDKIILGNKQDNFWEMGATGPCGPSSEIHIDIRPLEERKKIPGQTLVNQDHPLVIELWNLVFIQYQRLASKALVPLPQKHVDTGMGLERLAMVLQGKTSNYDTDIFQPFIRQIEIMSQKKYDESPTITMAMRVIADHIRAITLAIADGEIPSNRKAGYVVKRILRRAIRYGYSALDFKKPFLYKLVNTVAKQFIEISPHIQQQQSYIAKIIQEEENSFLKTLANGLQYLDQAIQSTQGNILSGDTVFTLYDTYGFPPDLTALIAAENHFSIDQKGFSQAMEAQQNRSKQATTIHYQDWIYIHPETKPTFVGYNTLHVAKTVLIQYRTIHTQDKKYHQLVFEKTPFYPEGGGQVGDTGVIIDADNVETQVIKTQKENDLIIHYTTTLPKDINCSFHLRVHANQRQATTHHHTATHLLQAALIQVLGKHVVQKGSLVTAKSLRFDFTHFQKITSEEIQTITQIINQNIRANIPVVIMEDIPIAKAKNMGAQALFGEKYGEQVRVVKIGDHSTELCGGTHAQATGDLGIFQITQETAVAAGVRRIEAMVGRAAEIYIQEHLHMLTKISTVVKQKDVLAAVETCIQEKKSLEKKLIQYRQKALHETQIQLEKKIIFREKKYYLAAQVQDHTADELKTMAFGLQKKYPQNIWVLASTYQQQVSILVMVDRSLATTYPANEILKSMLGPIQGKGGGQPHFAMGSGKNLQGISQAMEVFLKQWPF